MSNPFEQEEEAEGPKGLPGWMATFADMMALLMCFFVLLLSYSQMDAQKFKRIAGAMKEAFGVQNEIRVEDIPKGTSAIFDEFSLGQAEQTPIKQLEQATVDSSQEFLLRQQLEQLMQLEHEQQQQQLAQQEQALQQRNMKLLNRLQQALKQELSEGVLELELDGERVVFRILEKGAFGSASAYLQPQFKPVILKVTALINDIPGKVSVEGHTDNQPVSADMFENNWDLSAKRALAVAGQMLSVVEFDRSRMTVSGFAANKPLDRHDSIAARRLNRRVEIVVVQGKAIEPAPIELLKPE